MTVSPRVGDETVLTDTRRIVAVDGEWNWLLNQDEIDAYDGDGCPRLPLGGTQ